MRELAASRLILIIMCASYLLSAGLLLWARLGGQTVPGWKIAGWVLTGSAGLILLRWLAPGQIVVSIAIFALLVPWMGFALTEDTRSGHYIIAVVDLAGLLATIYALWIIPRA